MDINILRSCSGSVRGAGYIERIPLLILPFTALTLTEAARLPKKYTVLKKTAVLLTLCLVIITPFPFFSGRNFQSILISEDKARDFLRNHTQGIAGLYPEIKVDSVFTLLLTNSKPTHNTIYSLRQSDFIQTLYYCVGDITMLDDYIHKVKSTCNIIYYNPVAQLLQCRY
jgi:hypothetical protein